MKPESWSQMESHSINSLPALIHGSMTDSKTEKLNNCTDFNSSCTSTDLNALLMNYLGKQS